MIAPSLAKEGEGGDLKISNHPPTEYATKSFPSHFHFATFPLILTACYFSKNRSFALSTAKCNRCSNTALLGNTVIYSAI